MSLRLRLLLSAGTVVLAAVASVAYISSQVVRVELNQLTHLPGGASPQMRAAAANEIGARYRTHELEGMQEFLAEIRDARFPRSELILLGPQHRVLAASAPEHQNVIVREGADQVLRVLFGGAGRHSEIVVRGGLADVVVPGRGPIGSLLLTPRWTRPPDPMRNVNRWLLFAVAGVGLAALAFTALMARRVVAPIEQLQQATARVRAGSMSERVPVTSRDEVGQLAEAFNAMTARLEQQEQLRRNMVNDVAHELRTPLTNLRAGIEAIQDGLRAPDSTGIDALHDDVLLLQRLVEDLQTLALAEAGKLPLHHEVVDLQQELARFVRTQGDERIGLRVDRGLTVHVDPARLVQIVSNLVRNALAHIADHGKVEIVATAHGDAHVRLAVADDGAGIPADALPHIFDRFYRADASRARATGGAGLGLAIVRQLVEAHGGTVAVESSPRGTTFTVELPKARSAVANGI